MIYLIKIIWWEIHIYYLQNFNNKNGGNKDDCSHDGGGDDDNNSENEVNGGMHDEDGEGGSDDKVKLLTKMKVAKNKVFTHRSMQWGREKGKIKSERKKGEKRK